ncbi:peptidoglycan DD-metalloendopeptidase family protein [bacterium]|nr:peptidoglycan DD-metalloendopeptidase family protein [bacterium]
MKNLALTYPAFKAVLIVSFILFPLFEACPQSQDTFERQIRLRNIEKQRLTNERQETLVQINIAEKRTERVLEALKTFGENIERSETKLARLKEAQDLLRNRIDETGLKIKTLEVRIGEDKKEINQQLLALFYVRQARKMTLFIGLNSFEHYFRNQKLLQSSARVDIELLERYNQNLIHLQEENDRLKNQHLDLADLQVNEEAVKKLLEFERQQQVTYLGHLRTDRSAHVRYLREIQVELEQLNDTLYSLTVKKENQEKTKQFQGFYSKRNKLPSPVRGKVVHSYGQKQSPFYTMFRRGILVETAADEPVRSILSGRVVWAGPFRGYQSLVILDHGKGSLSVYGNLGELFVLVDDVIEQGYVLGNVAYDKVEERSLFYFEMRYNKRAVNPVRWLKKPRWKN